MCLVDFLRFSCLACLFLFVNGDRSDSSDLVGDDHTLKIMPTIWQWLGFQTSFTEDGDEFVPVRSSIGNEHPFCGPGFDLSSLGGICRFDVDLVEAVIFSIRTTCYVHAELCRVFSASYAVCQKDFALILWDLHGNHHHHRALLVAKTH